MNIPPSISPINFPSDLLKWMKINAKPKMALKLMQCCKYFQHSEFPYLVVKEINGLIKWNFKFLDGRKCVYEGLENVLNISKKLWIIENLNVSGRHSNVSNFIPKIAVCDIKELTLDRQKLTLEEFKFLTASGNIEDLFLKSTKISFKKGGLVFIDIILKCVPKVKSFRHMNYELLCFSPNFRNTFQKINTSKLEAFGLEINSYLNFEVFKSFMNKNPKIFYEIYFIDESLSKKETLKVENFVQEIIDSGITEYHPPPCIAFPGQTVEQRDALKELMREYNKPKKDQT